MDWEVTASPDQGPGTMDLTSPVTIMKKVQMADLSPNKSLSPVGREGPPGGRGVCQGPLGIPLAGQGGYC